MNTVNEIMILLQYYGKTFCYIVKLLHMNCLFILKLK